MVFCSAISTALKMEWFCKPAMGRLDCSKRQRWLHVGSTELGQQPKLDQPSMALGNSAATWADPWAPPSEVPLNPGNSHATLPHLRDTAPKWTLSVWHSQLLHHEKGLGRERRHANRSLSSLSIFSLGSGSDFTVIFLQDIQRV